MRLTELLERDTRGGARGDVEITGLTADSRAVEPGYLFAALPGTRADGREFIPQAIAKGAAAILAPPDVALGTASVRLIADDNPRRRFAVLAARFYGAQPKVAAAVTGTNGKTSVAWFTQQIWQHLGHRAASLGTLGLDSPGLRTDPGLTTPDPVALHMLLAQLARQGVDHLAIEASSHGLAQHRLDGVVLTAGAFTNLSRDHFDYHATLEAYRAAKLRLFKEVLPEGSAAVLNADADVFDAAAEVARSRGLRVIAYGEKGADLTLESCVPHGAGQRVTAVIGGARHEIDLPLVGAFQAGNALCALGLVIACGEPAEAALPALAHLAGAPGRLQNVAGHPNGAPIYVDYAHTPDALANVLRALRPHVTGRLAVVFGCGGDRDRGKRPLMGHLAATLADRVYVTDDNPRSEDPAAIRAEIMPACPGGIEIGDREEAIRVAIEALGPDDLLVVAGKGHEQGQIIGDEVRPFDDATVVRAAVASLAERVG